MKVGRRLLGACVSLASWSEGVQLGLGSRRALLRSGIAGVSLGWRSGMAAAAGGGAGATVTVQVDGQPQTFPAQPLLPPGFEKAFELRIRNITDEVFEADKQFPEAYPYSRADMRRLDETDDGGFYSEPRFVYHVDAGAVAALTHYYGETIPPGSDILDICSSWVSHYPRSFPTTMRSITGTGMNALELQANSQLTSFDPLDLNRTPRLPYPDESFDCVTCVVSVDYLNNPLDVFREVRRVLRPGGRFILSQSNRLFYTKAVAIWLGLDDFGRLELIGDYFHYAGGFTSPQAFDISAKGRGARDPMYIVQAIKEGKA
uniref:Methyltransferase type 11 domain-containing protein n=1 Tax=Rhizochromulina marina TaxID=1034831 RepID=A0A7S2WF82_9STRA|mmetsp:Transcript_23106/g.67309  ORF Transcript_23106/g.67309 Transcript_23106/m.67309 type:complete len:317 (+) Transcript_23106:3-953(+)